MPGSWVVLRCGGTRAGSAYTRTIGILPTRQADACLQAASWRASARSREPGIHAQQLESNASLAGLRPLVLQRGAS